MTTPTTPIRLNTQRPMTKEGSTALEVAIAIAAYVGLITLIMSGPLSTFSVWG